MLLGYMTALLLPPGRHNRTPAYQHAKQCSQPLTEQPSRLEPSAKPAQAAWCNKLRLQTLAASYMLKGQAKLTSMSGSSNVDNAAGLVGLAESIQASCQHEGNSEC